MSSTSPFVIPNNTSKHALGSKTDIVCKDEVGVSVSDESLEDMKDTQAS